ncbi:MAG: right-handed parallel beta-helix repeat-containing protein, partial [Alphaproteobacteria bacterium]
MKPAAEGSRAVIPASLYVDDDNAGAQDGSALRPFRKVQQAISAAQDNAVIAVAGGVYPENIRVQEKAVRLYGGYAGGTKADYAAGTGGNFKARDPAVHASHLQGDGKDSVVILYESGATIVDGFQITGGGPSSVTAPSRLGGGFYVYQGAPTISHNVIEKNQTCSPDKPDEEARGGGIYASGIYSDGASLTILYNMIRNNVSGRGAGIFSDGPKLVIRGNTIQNNIGVADHGGGAYLNSPNAEISHNRIEGNEIARELGYGWGGGMIVVNTGGHYKLSHNVFTGNYAPSLGAGFFADEGATASMEHDLVYGNKTKPDGEGAAVYVDGNEDGTGSSLTLNHVTIADHTSTPMVNGNAVKATFYSKLVVKNCILWNNGGDDFEVDDKSKGTVTYTLSRETIKGTGNLSKDPLFVNAAEHDYRLRQGSPALGAAEAANGARANLGADIQAAPVSTGTGVKPTTPAVQPMPPSRPKPKPTKTTSKSYLLRGTAGELPSEVGDDNTKLAKVESPELGGAAVQVDVLDTFGQKVAKVADWAPFDTLCLDIINTGTKESPVEFNLFHSETQAFATRVVAPFVLTPGKNEVRIAVKGLKNTNGSPAKLSEVRRWFVASESPVTLLVGDIFLEAPLLGREPDVRNTEQLRAVLLQAEPGTTIALAPGRYSPDISVEALRGTSDQPIIIAAADERDPPHFVGGKVAFHFVGCGYVTLRGVKVSGCTGNGINADDAGNADEPSQGMVFENIVIEDIGPTGTRNGLKLSGLDNFAVRGCTFSGWGGSAIDMVGCHDGVVRNCQFLGKSGFSQDTG